MMDDVAVWKPDVLAIVDKEIAFIEREKSRATKQSAYRQAASHEATANVLSNLRRKLEAL